MWTNIKDSFINFNLVCSFSTFFLSLGFFGDLYISGFGPLCINYILIS